MAKDRKDFADPEHLDTLIGKEVVVEGKLDGEGDVQINGQFIGEIAIVGDLIVGEHGKVKAEIAAKNVYVGGEVEGEIEAKEKLQILETGRVTGNVTSEALSIEPGGILKGSSQMQEISEDTPTANPTFEVEEEKLE
ncbi:TPA: cell shape determination protein CcmA [Patescibacteria group bacterium]|nr:cell shape determination protein CcmA [Patescibacteria group bacterium]